MGVFCVAGVPVVYITLLTALPACRHLPAFLPRRRRHVGISLADVRELCTGCWSHCADHYCSAAAASSATTPPFLSMSSPWPGAEICREWKLCKLCYETYCGLNCELLLKLQSQLY